MKITHDGEIFAGTPEKLIPVFEGKGYQAERDNQNAHGFWQVAEYLKREHNDLDHTTNNHSENHEERRTFVRGNRKGYRKK